MRGFGQVGSGRQAVGICELVFHPDHSSSLEANTGHNGENHEKEEKDDNCANKTMVGDSSDTHLE